MKLPDFPLAPWEVPRGSDIPLVAAADFIFEARWRGDQTELWVRQIKTAHGKRTFFRDGDGNSDEVGNWLTGTTLFSPQFLAEMLEKKGVWNFDSIARRQFYLDGARYGHVGAIELRIGWRRSSWRLRVGRRNEVVSFQSPLWTPEEFVAQRAAQIGRLAKNWLKDENSPARFALDWTHLSHFERKARVFQVSADEFLTIKNLLRNVFVVSRHKYRALLENALLVSWEIRLQQEEDFLAGISRRFTEKQTESSAMNYESGEFWGPRSPFLTRWRETIWNFYRVGFDEELFRWADRANQRGCHLRSVVFFVQDDCIPTPDEFNRAQTELRQWCEAAGIRDDLHILLDNSVIEERDLFN